MIGVMDQLAVWLAAAEGHHERGDDQVSGLAFAHGPADERAVVQVPDAGEEELAVLAGELGDVGDPAQIRGLGGEVALSRSGAGTMAGWRPLRHLRRPCTPTRPSAPMSRATRWRPTRRPLWRSWPHTRGAP